MTGNRYGMGSEEQVREFETWLRSEPDRFLLACLADPATADEERALYRVGTDRAAAERPGTGSPSVTDRGQPAAMNLDEDAVVAGADLVGRTGATDFEVGYIHDDVPAEEAGWYAHAKYRGARITTDDHRGPVEAVEALARRLLEGGKCTRCGGVVALSDAGAMVYPTATLADGTRWDLETARAAGMCRWTRNGRRWVAGCTAAHPRQPGQKRGQRQQPKRSGRKGRR